MDSKRVAVLVAAAVFLLCVGVARSEDSGPEYRVSCLHYCQKHNYGHPIKYCCRAAHVVLGTAPSAAATYSTTTATSTIHTLNTLVPVIATPVLAHLHGLSVVGPAVSAHVPGNLHTATITPHSHPGTDLPRDRGECPPSRDYCPRAIEDPYLTVCHSDEDCAAVDKCCYDACVMGHVCKTSLVVHRHRRSHDPSHVPYGRRDPGAAAPTEVVVREDGEPVHVLLDQNGNAVSAAEGDLVTIITGFHSGAPKPLATVPVSVNNFVYIVEDEDGEVVEDASGNTLTLIRPAEGPTLLIHDEGMQVVTGRHAPADGVFAGRVKSTLIPDLTVHSGRRYSRDTSEQNYQSRRVTDPVLTGHGRTVTLLQSRERLTVVNSDGVTFVVRVPTTAGDNFHRGQYASIAVVDTDKFGGDAMVDGEGNLIVDESGRPITLQDIMDTNLDDTHFVIVDGHGDAVTLVDVNKNEAILVDHLGHEVLVEPGEYYLILEDHSSEATVHQTEEGVLVIVDGSGNVVDDEYGHPLLVVPSRGRRQRSVGLEDDDEEGSGSGEPEDFDVEASGGAETEPDMSGAMDHIEEEEEEGNMMEGVSAEEEGKVMESVPSEKAKEEDQSGLLHLVRRHLLTVMPLQKVRRSTEEDGESTEAPTTTTTAPGDDMERYDEVDESGKDEEEEEDEEEDGGVMEGTSAQESAGRRRRRFVLPMWPLPLVKRAVPAKGDGMEDETGHCQEGMDCGNMEDTTENPEETTPNPEYQRRKRSSMQGHVNDGNVETDIPETTTYNPEETTPNPEYQRRKRSSMQGHVNDGNVETDIPETTTYNPDETTPNPEYQRRKRSSMQGHVNDGTVEADMPETTYNPEETTDSPENMTGDPEEMTDDPEHKRRRRTLFWSSVQGHTHGRNMETTENPEPTTDNPNETTDDPELNRRTWIFLSSVQGHTHGGRGDLEQEEEDVYATTTEGSPADYTEGDVDVDRGRRSVIQEEDRAAHDYSPNRTPLNVFLLPDMMRDFGFHAVDMANDIADMNQVLLKAPSTIAGEVTRHLNMRVKDPGNFMFLLAHSVERIVNTAIEVLQRTDIGFGADPDGRVLGAVLTRMMEAVLHLLEEALDIASHIRRLTSAHGHNLYL